MKRNKWSFFCLFVILCGVWVGCSDDRHSGGVTDIGNSIAGRVFLADGNSPAASARVVAYADSWNGLGVTDSVETLTDSLGYFAFSDMPAQMQVLYLSLGSEKFLSNAVKDSVKYILGEDKALSGSIASQSKGSVRIVGTDLVSPLDSNGNFSFEAVPNGNLSLVYMLDGIPQAHFEFSTVDIDSGKMRLPQLELSDAKDSVMVIVDTPTDSTDPLKVLVSVPLSKSPTQNLYGFVMPVKFNDRIDFEIFEDPDMLKVLAEDGSELDFEVDYWTPTASQGVLWIRLDSLLAGEDSVNLYLMLREESQKPKGAFFEKDSVMASVHMNGDAKIHAATDSDAAYGVIGYGATLTEGQYISLDSINPCSGDFTLSVWALWNGDNGNHQILFAKRASWADSTLFQWYFETNTDVFAVYDVVNWDSLSGALNRIDLEKWNMLSLVSKNDSMSMYVNGEQVSGPVYLKLRDIDMVLPFRVGGNDVEAETWNGSLDEIRVVTKARSAEWLRMEYETQYAAKNILD
jgi:hypothetical protein